MFEFVKNLKNTYVFSFFFLLGLVTFSPVFLNGFVADDNIYILDNPLIKNFNLASFFLGSSYYTGDLQNLSGIYYKPVFTLITSLLYQVSFGYAFFFHVFQLFLHVATSFLLYLLFLKFFKKTLALLLATLFLIHPGNVEAVVYIANLQDILFPFFGISALLIALKPNINKLHGSLIALFLLLSLLSKESGILFLPTILVLTYLKNRKNFALSCILVFVVFMGYLFLRIGVAHVYVNHQAIAPIMEAPITVRILTIPKIIYSYMLLFLFPKNLWWGQHWVVQQVDLSNFYVPLFVIMLLGLALFTIYLRSKTNESRKTFLFFLSVLILGLFLHMQIIPLDFTFAERWFYFICIGFLGLTGVLLEAFSNLFKKHKHVFLFLAVILVFVFAIRSFIRTTNWKSDLILTQHDNTHNPGSFVLENNLGLELLKTGNYKEAETHLEKSLSYYPTQSAYGNLAFIYSKLKKSEKSLSYYKKALSLGDYYLSYQNLIAEEIRQNELKDAENETQKALKKYPNNPKLWLLYALISYNLGDVENATLYAQQANLISPGSGDFLLSKISKKEKINL